MNLKMWLGVALVASMAVFWVVYFALEHQKKQKKSKGRPAAAKGSRSNRAVFDELCEKHHLTESEVSVLKSTAKQQGLEMPALLFVEPAHLQKFSESGDGNAAAARGLATKLFGA